MTNLDYIKKKSKELHTYGVSNSKNEIIWFLEHTNILDKSTIYALNPDLITINTKLAIDSFVSKRKKLIPFQYIINSCDFYGKDFAIDKRALIPRPETETIIHHLKKKDNLIMY